MQLIEDPKFRYRDALLALATSAGVQSDIPTPTSLPIEELIAHFATNNPGPKFAFKLGRLVPVTTHGLIGIGFLTAPTLEDAIRYALKNQQLYPETELLQYKLETKGDYWDIIIKPLLVNEASQYFLIDLVLTLIDSHFKIFTGKERNFSSVYLTHANRNAHREYQRALGGNVLYDANNGGFSISKKILSCRSSMADPLTFNQATSEAQAKSDALRRNQDIEIATRQVIRRNFGNDLSLSSIAEMMQVSERNLRYQLKKKHIRFSKLVDEERLTLARELLLSENTPISKIAFQLGYSSESNFSAAFKRWTGLSPRHWKKHTH